MLGLTRKLIEIRQLLKSVDSGPGALTLPSIVVVGSQSSGKSSVLEAIVGQEFLPKGANMVTRRPIELTLIHSPEVREDYCEFPQLGLGKVRDFAQVRRTLTDLNLAVSDAECVSDVPIEMRVYSPNVPDLTLVDLPGYIQVVTRDQPPILKEKIAALCQKYIQEPNIILAVCAADVDLANSEALRASRKVDPLGLRTIGVVTKMDLVDADVGAGILENKSYPLALGYIGVVNSAKMARGFSQSLIRSEDAFFRSHPEYANSMVGASTLRRRLMNVLEEHMGRNLHAIVDNVQSELDNARYEFKVHYNDRSISAESYVAESMDVLKQRFKQFTQEFGKPQVREHIRAMLEAKLLKVCSDVYWRDEFLPMLPREAADSPYWQNKLDVAAGALTKSGVGKATVQLVVDLLTSKMEDITTAQNWAFHEDARQQVLQSSAEILRSKFHTTVDQVENTIKPYKFEVDCTELEWREGQKRAAALLEAKITDAQTDLQAIKTTIGRRRLRNAIKHLNKADKDAAALVPAASPAAAAASGTAAAAPAAAAAAAPAASASSSFSLSSIFSSASSSAAQLDEDDLTPSPASSRLLERARQALDLQSGIAVMQQRLAAVKSRQCSVAENKVACPEVYLSVVSEKLSYTAVMFIYIELLNEFFFHLPREMDSKLYYGLSRDQIRQFARQNPAIMKHLDIQERKATLELVMEKLKDISRNRK
ncbi:mitochondrial dynamin GTPase Msp1 [Polyrhizophydium stewartii]|uniref:dynamin GTPase n=1 Tax=Polyrhizophydium stewartii TaxID=2732419 RepID=A0ABR4MWL0_9FUNG